MLSGRRFVGWPLVAVAVAVGGCGSSETASRTTIASAPTTASAPATASAPTTTTAPPTNPSETASQRRSAEEARRHQREAEAAKLKKAREARTKEENEAAHRMAVKVKRELAEFKRKGGKVKQNKPLEAAGVPQSERFPKEVQYKFLSSCKAGKVPSSSSSCECLLAKFEESKVEMEHSIAELLFIKVEVEEGVPLPSKIQQWVDECHTAGL